MSLNQFKRLGGLPEAFLAVVLGVAVWSFYGFPYVTEVALGCVALGGIGALILRWKKSLDQAD
ncbi:MAG: hypothetical protein J0H42_09140 [Rhizobiales bacterium]|nr:hypothetical protein [Hyphomicrobiales bacterium]